ncbi:hydantoinase/oxoprolinase family protein [Allorhizobium pseudoryzae]|uniref:hydantoinase/oxoprolinase family protein n=1 Tax=Allorhizobium pseudoryzae TaxID=379684 RepID=UPI003D057E72
MRVGVEVGGTFSDLVIVDGKRVEVIKVPSTPHSPDIGVLDALNAADVELHHVKDLVHGSTVATNALLERRGARVAFVTTKGFRDILFLQRHDRRNIYELRYRKPEAVMKRRDCFEVDERLGADGSLITPLDEEQVAADLVPALRSGGYDAVAICLLSSYSSPAHETKLRDLLAAALPDTLITCSMDVSREFREYERASTTTLAAYVQPVIDAYLDRLSSAIREKGFRGIFSIMQSNGGRIPAIGMRKNAITALFSGPAAGVAGAVQLAGRSGFRDIITFDMGGTSTDVSLVSNGKPTIKPDTEIDGLPVRTPVVDIVTVGAGGGSLIWMDEGGMVRVGPRSAGAVPGPACYGKGGTQPTITDAHVIRGTIRPEGFLGGTMEIYPAKAFKAFEPIAAALGVDVKVAAASALRLSVANIVRAIQLVSTERGHDPRDHALVPYGGAGPLLAAEVAQELGISTIVVPPNPGVISAYGLLAADFIRIEGVTRRFPLDADAPAKVRQVYSELVAAAREEFGRLGLNSDLTFSLTADMRFLGQAFEIPVNIPSSHLEHLSAESMAKAFGEAHQKIYLHGAGTANAVEFVSFRLETNQPQSDMPAFHERSLKLKRPAATTVQSETGSYEARIIAADDLGVDAPVQGPALIEGYSSSTWVPPGWTAFRDVQDNFILQKVEK